MAFEVILNRWQAIHVVCIDLFDFSFLQAIQLNFAGNPVRHFKLVLHNTQHPFALKLTFETIIYCETLRHATLH